MSAELTRLVINLNQETAKAMKEITARNNSTYTETVRRAIMLLAYLEHEVAEGRVVVTSTATGRKKRELVLL